MGTDAYVYLIKFDKPIQLILSGAESESHNEFGDYVYKTEQVDEYQIKITSYLSIKAAKVNASNISLVNNIYQSVSNDKLLTLKIK